MLEPFDNRHHRRSKGVDQPAMSLPLPPPGLASRVALRPLRALPSPDGPEIQGQDAEAQDPATSGDRQLRFELEATRNELNALQDMLEELPVILERKFQLRLQGLLQQQRALIARNESLRAQILALAPSPAPTSLLEGAASSLVGGFRRSVQRALGMAQPLR
jgi:DNA repair exonuclease SbcCD ATPase subunit